MFRGNTIVISLFFSALSIAILVYPKQNILARFSLQGTINPTAIQEGYNPNERVGYFDNNPVAIPSGVMALLDSYAAPQLAYTQVLGDSTLETKRIEVDLTNQRLYAYEGDRMIYNFLISSGKWGRTPTGTFDIWIKLRATKMSGGKKELGTYYYLPNVPYTMYFYNAEIPKWRGFGIHGAYWHNNFGNPMSHGCINMKPEEAGIVYEWAQPDMYGKHTVYAKANNPGTKVVIYGTAPNS